MVGLWWAHVCVIHSRGWGRWRLMRYAHLGLHQVNIGRRTHKWVLTALYLCLEGLLRDTSYTHMYCMTCLRHKRSSTTYMCIREGSRPGGSYTHTGVLPSAYTDPHIWVLAPPEVTWDNRYHVGFPLRMVLATILQEEFSLHLPVVASSLHSSGGLPGVDPGNLDPP
jgi:hypothetical protein